MSIVLNDNPNTYDVIDDGATPLLPVYIIVAIITITITVLMNRRFRERKSKTAKYLFMTFFTYSILEIILIIGFLEMYLTGYKMILYRLSLSLGYAGIMVANIYIILFGAHIFPNDDDSGKHDTTKLKIGISVIIAIFLILPWNYYGYNDAFIPNWAKYFRIITSSLMLIFSMIIYIGIFKKARIFSLRMKERWAKYGFAYIGYSQLSEMGFFVFTLLDTLWFTFTDETGYSFFIYFSWICVAFFLAFAYIGFIMPDWFKRRYSDK